MDAARYPPPKRRRTSSADSSSSRNSTTEAARAHPPPLRHSESTRSAGRDMRRERGYSSSRSRDGSRDDTPRRDRTRSPRSRSRDRDRRRRASRSLSASSAYDSALEQQQRQDRSRTRRHSRSRSRSDSYSPPPGRRSRSQSASRLPSASPLLSRPREKPKSLTFAPLLTIPRAHARGITCLKFSPDMTLLATASADNAINIYSVPANPSPNDATQFKHIRTLRAHLAGVNAISWSPVGPPYTLVSASDDKSILLWSPLSSDFPIAPSPLTGHSNYVYSLAFSPKGNMLVSGSYDEAVFLWDVRSGRVMRSLPAHSDPVGGVDFLRDGTMVCSCAGDGLIRIWDSGTGQCLRTLVDENRKSVTSVRFSPNGKFVLAWTLDNCVRLWNYVEGRCVKTYQGHVNSQYSLSGVVGSYSYPYGGPTQNSEEMRDEEGMGEHQERRLEAFIASGSEDGDILVWDITSKDILWRGKAAHKDVVLSIDFGRTAEGRGLLVSGGKDRDLRIWMLEGDEADREFFASGGAAGTHGTSQDRHAGHEQGDDDVDMDMMDMDNVVEGPTAVYGNGGGASGGVDHMLVDGATPDMDHR